MDDSPNVFMTKLTATENVMMHCTAACASKHPTVSTSFQSSLLIVFGTFTYFAKQRERRTTTPTASVVRSTATWQEAQPRSTPACTQTRALATLRSLILQMRITSLK